MTEDEITKITKIMLTADHWCPSCSSDLIKRLQKVFPDFQGTIDGIEQHRESYELMYRKAVSLAIDQDDYIEPDVTEMCI